MIDEIVPSLAPFKVRLKPVPVVRPMVPALVTLILPEAAVIVALFPPIEIRPE